MAESLGDYELHKSELSTEVYNGLAAIQTAMPRFASKFDSKKTETGEIIDIDEDFPRDEFDDEDELYDSGILSNFYYDSQQVKTELEVMEDDKDLAKEKRTAHFSPAAYAKANFEDMKKEMVELPVVDNLKVYKEIFRRGNGNGKIPERCKIFFHYIAVAEGKAEPFDSSLARRTPGVQDLRSSVLVPGFEVALKSMEVGEVARFIVPPELAYREMGISPRVPPNASILYIVEMIHVIDEEVLKTFAYLTPEERAQLPFSQVLEECHKLRNEGNSYYKDSNYQFAVRKWRRGVVILEGYPVVYSDDEDKRNELLWTFYSNLASAYLQMDKPAQACMACKHGLKLVPDDAKVNKGKLLYRFAKAKLMFKDAEAAKRLIGEAIKLLPKDPNIVALKMKIYEEEEAQEKSYKAMCERMAKLGHQS